MSKIKIKFFVTGLKLTEWWWNKRWNEQIDTKDIDKYGRQTNFNGIKNLSRALCIGQVKL